MTDKTPEPRTTLEDKQPEFEIVGDFDPTKLGLEAPPADAITAPRSAWSAERAANQLRLEMGDEWFDKYGQANIDAASALL